MEPLNPPLEQWCADGPVRFVTGDEVQVDTRGAGSVSVRVARHEGAVELGADWAVPDWFPRAATRVLPSLEEFVDAAVHVRSALLSWRASETQVELRMPVYLDGLGRHTFIEAACEVARAYETLASTTAGLEERREEFSELEAALDQAGRDADEVAREVEEATTSPEPSEPVSTAGPMVRVGAPTDAFDNERSVVARLEPGRWYSAGEEAGGWLPVRDEQGAWAWIPASAAVERRD